MIKNIILDFGDVFINLDKEVINRELATVQEMSEMIRLKSLNDAFEIGAISAEKFLSGLQEIFPGRSRKELEDLWNAMLLDFPIHRLEFLEELANTHNHRLFLLSNTNALHIPHVKTTMGETNFLRFRNSFEKFYLSHEVQLRKPNVEIFELVLTENKLQPRETLFVDDTLENIQAASKLGLKTWHLQVGQEDVTDLTSKL